MTLSEQLRQLAENSELALCINACMNVESHQKALQEAADTIDRLTTSTEDAEKVAAFLLADCAHYKNRGAYEADDVAKVAQALTTFAAARVAVAVEEERERCAKIAKRKERLPPEDCGFATEDLECLGCGEKLALRPMVNGVLLCHRSIAAAIRAGTENRE